MFVTAGEEEKTQLLGFVCRDQDHRNRRCQLSVLIGIRNVSSNAK